MTPEFLKDLLQFVETEESRFDEDAVCGITGAALMADRYRVLASILREHIDAQLAL